ncbi:MAG: transcription termination factor Rho [Coriobacteriia bacterium]|nr:transcription termination factor Rho [Coriobacteriia bacterium]
MSESPEEKPELASVPQEPGTESAEAPAPKTRARKTTARKPSKKSAKGSEGADAKVSADESASAKAADAEPLTGEEKPKRQTRARKKKADEDAPAKATAPEEESKPRRRGRPAKKDAEATEAEKPKARTRTRKAASKAADKADAEQEAVFSDVVSPEELMRIIAEAKAATCASAGEAFASSEGSEPTGEPKPAKEVEPSDAKADEAEDKPASDADGAPKRQARTRKKKTADTEAADQAQPEAGAAEGSEIASADAEQPRHKRRRERDDNDRAGNERGNNGNNDRNNQNDARSRRREKFEQRKKNKRDRNKPVQPKTSREELAALKVAELRAKADELGVEHKGVLKAALVDLVYEAAIKAEGFVEVEGILDIMPDGFGFVRTNGYLSGPGDAYVHASMVRRNGLRKGDMVKGQTRPARQGDKFPALQTIISVNGKPLEELGKRVKFSDLTPVFPDERLIMEHGKNTITARVIDLCAPIGKGQRGLIVSPPKAGKTTVLKNIAAAISANNPEVHLICLLVDERPEEVTDMQRSIKGEVVASTFDMPCENHIACAEMVIERAKRLVEEGEDVVVLLDSLTRLARAYNLAQPASGRILSGGVDSTALYPPKKFLGAARNIENGGSLTILASALVETGSKMDEVIFEEFKGTGNMELKLDRQLAERRIFPAIDPVSSGTRREDLLLDPQEAPLIWAVRRILSNRNNTERAMETLIKSLYATKNNQEFLVRTAKKAQGRSLEENAEF